MNLFKSPLKRATAVGVGAFLGMAGAFALTGPASAHAPLVAGETSCLSDGTWTVNWTVGNDYGVPATIKTIQTSTSQAAQVGDSSNEQLSQVGRHGRRNGGGKGSQGAASTSTGFTDLTAEGLTVGTVIAPKGGESAHGSTTQAVADTQVTLQVRLSWTDGYESSAAKTVSKPAACAAATPSASVSVPPSDEESPEPSASVSTPPAEESPAPSTPASPTPSASEDTFGEAEPIFEVTCDSLTIGLDNPADGVEIPLVLEPSEGEKQTLVIKPGEKKSATFDASEGFFVKVSVQGFEDEAETIDWEAPEDCDTSGAGGGDEDELPLTGAAAGSIAAGAVVLLGAGVALFFVARRRKLKFTA